MRINGAEIVIQCLKEQGVKTVFGFPGGAILHVYDALYKHADEITHILTSHEQGAAHAADGYARATGEVGVCLATSGPGATNLVTGIATAYMDSSPMVAITCNVALPLLGKDSFQEIDITGITMPITKHNYIVKDVKNLACTIRKAFRIAKSGRPGPVLIDIPKDVTAMIYDYEPMDVSVCDLSPRVMKEHDEVIRQDHSKELEQAIEILRTAERPYVFIGGGVISSNAYDELRTFIELLDAPVCDSLMGKGGFDGESLRYTGMLGMHGTKASNLCVSQADVLVVLGARFSDRVTGNAKKFVPHAKIIQIDIDEAEVNKNIMIHNHIIGDIKSILQEINALLPQQDHADWLREVRRTNQRYPLEYHKNVLNGPYIVEEIYKRTRDNAIIVTEVGQHQMWAAQFYRYTRPRTFLSSGGLGTMGFGLGAAIGAKLGKPDQTVINIAGDGCFRMNMNELATAVRFQIPIIQVVMNNHVLGMVRQWQSLFYEQRYSQTILQDPVDFVLLAEAMGAKAVRVKTQEEFIDAFDKALTINYPFVIDCQIDSDDKVWPMVAPGAGIDEVFDESDLHQ